MICSNCGKKCKCVDSREKLPYGKLHKTAQGEPVKERKYLCAKCCKAFYTQEFIADVKESVTTDKRVTGDI